MRIAVKPLWGIEIDGRAVRFGANKAEVEQILGSAEEAEKQSYYFQSEMRIDFDSNDWVEFIEFLAGLDGNLRPDIYGMDAF